MNIASILARKGGKVVTCRPEQSIRQALALLAEHNIGALVVVDETGGAGGHAVRAGHRPRGRPRRAALRAHASARS